MTLNLWVLRDWLEEFSPGIDCKSPKRELTGIRLYQPGMKTVDYALYVARSDAVFHDGGSDVVCFNGRDFLRLATDDLAAVVNRIQDAFSFYARWYNACTDAIAAGCSLPALIARARDVLAWPLMIVNSAQIMVACSDDLNTVLTPEDWASLTEHRSLPDEKLKLFNQSYNDSFYTSNIYTVPAGFFPTKSYCKHIFLDEERLGTVILKVPELEFPLGTLYLLKLFTALVEEWVRANEENAFAFRLTSYFVRLLDGNLGALPILLRQLSLFGWEEDCRKRLFVVRAPAGRLHFDMQLSRSLSEERLSVFMTPYRDQLVILSNLDSPEEADFSRRLGDVLRLNGYCAGSSFPFTALERLVQAYQQTLTSLEYSPRAPGKLYRCQDVSMRIIAKVVEQNVSDALLHPAVPALKAYDREHNTEYCRTLFCFLKNERRHQQTSQELFIHRNTLFLRLDKIRALWPLDLDDEEERFYLLFSFYQDQYAAPGGR